jgi:hypothetical protein
MISLSAVALKTFVPAKNFELSKKFYAELGFTQRSEFDDIAFFDLGECSFLLQNFYVKEHASNMVMHLLVADVHEWYAHVCTCDFEGRYGAKITPIKMQPWGMTEFVVIDPCGVCWHIAQNTPGFKPVGKLPA